MKTRNGLVLLSLMMIAALSGCQRSAATGDDAAVGTEEVSSAAEPAQRTMRVRNPETGRVETRPVPAIVDPGKMPAAGEDAVPAASSARYTTQRVRNPETGRAEIRQVPVASKPKPPQPHEFAVGWQEDCQVQQAFEASAWVLEDFGLAQGLTDYTTQRVRNPRTGRIETRRVPKNSRGARSDGLSAFLEGNATAEIKFVVRILLVPPESSAMTIDATSMTQPEAVLEQQSLFLKEEISKVIAAEPAEPPAVPYPETMMLDCGVKPAVDAIYSWAERQGFERDSRGERDQYYRMVTCGTGSGIRLEFTLRLVEPERTRLDIEASNYEGKDEFGMILRDLMETLEGINAQPPQATAEPKPYPEMLMLNHTVNHVADVLGAWIKNMGFATELRQGDSFSRSINCRTGSGVRLRFSLKLLDTETTRLHINIFDYERKDEFPMILKSLQEALDGLEEGIPAVAETGG